MYIIFNTVQPHLYNFESRIMLVRFKVFTSLTENAHEHLSTLPFLTEIMLISGYGTVPRRQCKCSFKIQNAVLNKAWTHCIWRVLLALRGRCLNKIVIFHLLCHLNLLRHTVKSLSVRPILISESLISLELHDICASFQLKITSFFPSDLLQDRKTKMIWFNYL